MKDPASQHITFFRSQQFVFLRLFLVLALLPIFLVSTIFYLQSKTSLIQQANRDLENSAEAQRQRINDWLENLEIQVAILAKDGEITAMDPEEATGAILTFSETLQTTEAVILADPTGQIIAADSEAPLSINVADRTYFLKAMQGEANFSDALISRQTGDVIVVRAEPIQRNGQVVGVLAVMTPTSKISQILEKMWTGETTDAYLINQDGLVITRPRFTEALKQVGLFKERPELEAKIETKGARAVLAGEQGVSHYRDYRDMPVIGAYFPVNDVNWGLLVEVDEAEVLATVSSLGTLALIVAMMLTVAVGGIAFMVSRALSSPILVMAEGAQRLAAGEIIDDARLEAIARRQDELGLAGKAFSELAGYFREMGSAAEKIADGNLTVSVHPRSQQDMFGNAFAMMTRTLRGVIERVKENADSVSLASEQLASVATQAGQATSQVAVTIQQVAKGTTQQSESVSHTAASVEQMSRAIEGIARGAQDQTQAVTRAAQITTQMANAIQQVSSSALAGAKGSQKAAQVAQSGADTISVTIRGMEAIQSKVNLSAQKVQEMGARSEQIGVIVETIEDIASQTNLLALNAAIEAARAGEHGKGFAVVADEVRKLAERSSLATKEIGGLVKDIQRTVSDAVAAMDDGSAEVERGVEQANQAGVALEQILSAAKEVNQQVAQITTAADQMGSLSNELIAATDSVSAVVEENTAAAEEMAANSSEVTLAIENIASVSEENSAAVEEVSASAEEMSAQVEEVTASAQSLAEMAETLQQVVAQFKVDSDQQIHGKDNQAPEPVLRAAKVSYSSYGSNGHSSAKALMKS